MSADSTDDMERIYQMAARTAADNDRLRTRLSEYECQSIPRDELASAPAGATQWRKTRGGKCFWIAEETVKCQDDTADAFAPAHHAPDLYPERDGPQYLHIVDVEQSNPAPESAQ